MGYQFHGFGNGERGVRWLLHKEKRGGRSVEKKPVDLEAEHWCHAWRQIEEGRILKRRGIAKEAVGLCLLRAKPRKRQRLGGRDVGWREDGS